MSLMSLAPGTQLGPYQVTAPLGAGGMGEVYRASDTKLKREVALKVLPELFANDAQRMARFEREAQVLASLNHSHIAQIHGLEESDGIRALVMELVEGTTLSERIARGPVPVEEAVLLTKQIAEALEYAHDKGIIHRDLKPANIKLTPDGQVKVLDFGLAKAMEGEGSEVNISTSPTISAAATRAGVLLGTAAYMSPEQAKGKPVDRRADIWAFGCVLFEMLAGKSAFTGETISDTLAAVIRAEPEWNALPARTPEPFQRLLRRCLNKDAKRRLQAIGEARILMEDFIADPGSGAVAVSALTAPHPLWHRFLPWAATAVLSVVATLALWRPWQRTLPPHQSIRVVAEIGADAALSAGGGTAAVLAPGGTHVAFVVRGADQQDRIYFCSLDQLQATALAGTEGARDPFFSPDGQWIAFFAQGKLKKVSVQGGAVVTLCDAEAGFDRGGSWAEDGTIVFAPGFLTALSRVSSAGGTPEPLTTLDRQAGEVTHRWPQMLSGGSAVLFTANTSVGTAASYDLSNVVVLSMVSEQRKTVLRGGYHAHYLPSGHLLYVHQGTLFAAPFDLGRLEVTGQAVPVLEGVVPNANGGVQVSFSETGSVVYLAGLSNYANAAIYWMGREGKFQPLREVPAGYYELRFSPDGRRLALGLYDGKRWDIWVYELERDALTRLTFTGDINTSPVWTPDGQKVTYASQEKGSFGIYWRRADGDGDTQRLTTSSSRQIPSSWRPDGKVLAFTQKNSDTSYDIYTLSVEGDEKSGWKFGEPKPFVNTPFWEDAPVFSPDGRWLAYCSSESGEFEIYVRPFPGPGGKWQVSNPTNGGGGRFPLWSRNGKELFYRTPSSFQIMVVPYSSSSDSFEPAKAQLWSPGQFAFLRGDYSFDLHPDGKRFAVLRPPEGERQSAINKVNFIFNFSDELSRKAPSGKN